MNWKRYVRMALLFCIALSVGIAYADKVVSVDPGGNVHIRHEAVVEPDRDVAITVKTAPPEPKVEQIRIEQKPDPQAVWIPGYWRWDANTEKYEWVSGVWRHEIPGSVWHPGKWVHVGDSWERREGYWGPKESQDFVIVKTAPPAPKEEARPDAPGPGYVWIPGVWKYEGGDYKWIPGSWERPAGEGMTYIPGRYIKMAEGFEFVPGHWDYDAGTRTFRIKE